MEHKINGKTIRIPSDEITKSMQVLGLTQDEAIQMWLEDNGYEENEEQNALDEKAKAVKVPRAKSDKEKRTRAPRKPNDEKREIIEFLYERILNNVNFSNMDVINPERQIDFYVGGNHYSVTLTLHRPPKEK